MFYPRFIITTVITALSAVFLSSCSSDASVDEPDTGAPDKIEIVYPELPDPDYNSSLFSDIFTSDAEMTLSLSEVESYRQDDLTGDGWEKYDYTLMMGLTLPIPRILVFREGKVYTPLNKWRSVCGPTQLSRALALLAQKGVVKQDAEVLVSRGFTLGESAMTLSGRDYKVKNIKDGKIWLTSYSKYEGGRTGNGGRDLYVSMFNIGSDYADNWYRFESVEDAYAWAIEAFKEHYGDEVNLNDYTGGAIIFDKPMFNVSMIEFELQLYLSGELYL